MLIDTHCHLDFQQYDSDRIDVIRRAIDAGIRALVIPGIETGSTLRAIQLADEFREIYVAVGIHPNLISSAPKPLEQEVAIVREYAAHPKVVAIGEIGLDYYRDRTPPVVQREWFVRQLELAADLGLPVILHNRDATDDMFAVLVNWHRRGFSPQLKERPGVLHSFFGTVEQAEVALDLGLYIGITGPVTFRKATDLREMAAAIPEDRLLVETDSPYLTPHPFRGKRNEPAYLRLIVQELAAARDAPYETIARKTTQNAARLFSLDLGLG